MRAVSNTSTNYRGDLERMFYSSSFKSAIDDLNRKRRFQLAKLFLILGPVWLIGVIWAICIFGSSPDSVDSIGANNGEDFFIFFAIAVIIGTIIFIWKTIKDFKTELKSALYPMITDIIGNMEWVDESKAMVKVIDDDELKSTSLFGYFNRREYDDAFEGTHKGVKFKVSETHLMHETGSGKRRRVYTVFKGVVIEFTTNKNAISQTIVATKNDRSIKNTPALAVFALSAFAVVIQMFSTIGFTDLNSLITVLLVAGGIALAVYLIMKLMYRHNDKLKEAIKLEDPVFSKIFNVYSSDQVEARYLVTTGFMERFLNMQNSFSTKRAKCAFYGNKIMFAISTTRDLFEIGNLFRRVGDQKLMRRSFGELISILRMIDYFKLDENTGL